MLVVYHIVVRNKGRNLLELNPKATIQFKSFTGRNVQETFPSRTFPATALIVVFISITIESFYLHERVDVIKVFLRFFFDLKDVFNICREPLVKVVSPSKDR